MSKVILSSNIHDATFTMAFDDEDHERRRRDAQRTCLSRQRVTLFMICVYIVLGIVYSRRHSNNERDKTSLSSPHNTTISSNKDVNASLMALNESSSKEENKDTDEKVPKKRI